MEILREIIISAVVTSIGALISFETFKRTTKYKVLHEERAKAIKDIYSQFCDLKQSLKGLSNKIDGNYKRLNEAPSQKDYFEFDQKAVQLRQNVEKNAIYFPHKLEKDMIHILTEYKVGPSIAHHAHNDNLAGGKMVEFQISQYKELVNLLNGSILEPLRSEFQKVLGMDLVNEESTEK